MRHCMHEAETEVTRRKDDESDPGALRQGLTDT
jgi:hypothetical protein